MKRLTSILKSVALVALLIILALIALPKINFNIGETNINFNLADDFLKAQSLDFSDFKKGTGLYSTNVVKATYPEDTSFESVTNVYSIVTNRIKTALLTDVSASILNEEGKYSIQFEFPNYYKDPVQYVKWLVSKADVYFATAGENPQIIDLNDYDISGEIKTEYSSNYKDHLSFYFSKEKESLVSAYLSNTQYFMMYIDGIPSMYVLDFDNYTDTNIGRVRAVSVLSLSTSDERQIIDYINIVKSYFGSVEVPLSLSVEESVSEIPATYKPASLTTISIVLAFTTLLPVFLFIKKFNRGVVLRRFVWTLIFSALFVGLLKFIGAIISLDLVIGYLITIIIAQVFIANWQDIYSPRRTLLAVILVFGFLSKFHTINYSIGAICGTIVVGLIALIISSYYLPIIDFTIKFVKELPRKTKNIRLLKFRKK